MSHVPPAHLLTRRNLSSLTSNHRWNPHGSLSLSLRKSIATEMAMDTGDVDGIGTMSAQLIPESLDGTVRGARGMSLPGPMRPMSRLTSHHALTRRVGRGLRTLWQTSWRTSCTLFFDSTWFIGFHLARGFFLLT